MARNTLLLIFIHGFKGTDDTFDRFPEHLRDVLAEALPELNVVALVYPQYETRGVLSECVAGFREWLQNKVIDLEVEAQTPSPTIDPSVHVMLIGHSMGGIVAAETLLSIASDRQLPTVETSGPSGKPKTTTATGTPTKDDASHTGDKREHSPDGADGADESATTLLFPRISGILAFDTPFLGIHPGVIAHGAEAQYNTASAALNAYNTATRLFGNLSSSSSAAAAAASAGAAETLAKFPGRSWGSYALYAGGIATLAAAGGAAWVNRRQLASGWNWATSHLEFVGCLARGAELGQRVERLVRLGEECGVGFADFYTQLGTVQGTSEYAGKLLGEERTFCVVPKPRSEADDGRHEDRGPSPAKKRKGTRHTHDKKGTWVRCVNTRVDNEISAHKAMFTPRSNSDYQGMTERAKTLLLEWVDEVWYNKVSPDRGETSHRTR